MAYAINDEENKNNQQAQQPAQNPSMPPTTSSAPGSGPGSSAGKSTPQSTPAQPFQNLSAYLGANQPQITEQANQIAGNLNNQYGQVTSDINKGKDAFNTQVQGGYAAPNQTVVDQAASNPSDFVSKPENVKAFQSLYNDTYTGPDNFESSTPYGDLNAKVNKASSDASLLGTPAGLQTYFQNQNPNATKGGSILDAALLKGSPESITKIQNAAKPFSNLQDYLTSATNDVDANVANAKTTAANTSTALKNQFTGEGGVVPTFQKSLQDQLAQGKNDALARLENAKKALPGINADAAKYGTAQIQDYSKVSDQTLKDLGLTREQYKQIAEEANTLGRGVPNSGASYDMSPFDVSRYLTAQSPDVNITPDTFASASDYSKDAALSQLLGTKSLFSDPTKAGTANLDLADVNTQGLLKDLKDQYDAWTAAHPNVRPITY